MAPLALPLASLSVFLLALAQITFAAEDPLFVADYDGDRQQPVQPEMQLRSEPPSTNPPDASEPSNGETSELVSPGLQPGDEQAPANPLDTSNQAERSHPVDREQSSQPPVANPPGVSNGFPPPHNANSQGQTVNGQQLATKPTPPNESERTCGEPIQLAASPKQREIARILANPPRAFHTLLAALPMSIYGKDNSGNYVAFCNSEAIDWASVKKRTVEELSEHVRYLGLFFWEYIDKRTTSSLTVVIDAGGFSFSKVMDGSVKNVLRGIIAGLNATVPYVGERQGRVFLVNVSAFMKPLISFVSKLMRTEVELLVYSNRGDAALKEHIGEKHLPTSYGGTNPTNVEDSPAMKYMKSCVTNFLKQKKAVALKSKI